MALSSDESNRLAGLLSEHAERITQRWTEAVATDQAEQLLELSTPVVRLWEVPKPWLQLRPYVTPAVGGA
ncbi:hypothetical protein JNW88_03210 [Micromonospora sp. ATA32]|nr:hypothetical protein [Micromonospora sp. ATA32]